MSDPRGGANPYQDLSRRTGSGGPNRGLIIGGVVVLLVVVLAGVAIFVTGGDDDGGEPIDAVQEVAAVESEGQPLPPFPQVAGFVAPVDEDPAVGMTPPTLTGQDFGGDPVSIDPGDGRAKVVAFVAHWCPHCQAEVPLIQQWVDDGNLPDDVDLYAVSTDVRSDQNNYPPSEWLDREGWSEGILLDHADGTAANTWGRTGYPYLVFVDADGKVSRRASGEVPIADFEGLVQEISAA